MNQRRFAALLVAAVALASGCSQPQAKDQAVRILDARGQRDSSTLVLSVATCHAHPTVLVVSESTSQVHLRATTVSEPAGNQNACADGVAVSLAGPLAQRAVIDDFSGSALPISIAVH